MCKPCHALSCEDRQRRKINCTLQNALAEKAAWWGAMCYAGLAAKSLDFKPFLLIAPLSLRHSTSAAPQKKQL